MASETVTIPKARARKLEELENRVDTMEKIAQECVQKIDRLIRIAKGENP